MFKTLLSDLFFVLGRWANNQENIKEFLDQRKLHLEMRTNWNSLTDKKDLAKEYIKNQIKNIVLLLLSQYQIHSKTDHNSLSKKHP